MEKKIFLKNIFYAIVNIKTKKLCLSAQFSLKVLRKGMKGYFAFHVSVRDGFGHVDKATVQIYLLREDQRVRFVFRNQPAEIRARIGRFREVLGKG